MMFTFYIVMAIIVITCLATAVSAAVSAYYDTGKFLAGKKFLYVHFAVIILFSILYAHNALKNAIDERVKDIVNYECTGRNEGTVCRTDPGN